MKRVVSIIAIVLMVNIMSTRVRADGGIPYQNMVEAEGQTEKCLDAYFMFRNAQFFNKKLPDIVVDENIAKEASKRKDEISAMKERIGVDFTEVETSYKILCSESKGCIVTYVVEEWNDIHYRYPDSHVTDMMGFGTTHKLTIVEEKGDYIIKTDEYDESSVLGGSNFYKEVELPTVTEATVDNVAVLTVFPGYNVYNAINYSNAWVNSHNPQYSDYDNDGIATTSDCANFVSQCLYAGGIPNVNYGMYSSGWYKDSAPWVNVEKFNNFWINQGYTRSDANGNYSNMGNCIPGNPIYWLNSGGGMSGHLMLCVGNNSQGVPVYNAHSNAAYHVPISTIPNTLYTLNFKSCTHTTNSYMQHGNASTHSKVCASCSRHLIENHTWTYTAASARCTKCGYVRSTQ